MENSRARRSGIVVCDQSFPGSIVTPDSELAGVPKRLSRIDLASESMFWWEFSMQNCLRNPEFLQVLMPEGSGTGQFITFFF